MLDLEVAGSALRSTLWDVAIVVLAIGMVVLAVVACWWTVRECRRWVQDRETIRRRLAAPSVRACYRCGTPTIQTPNAPARVCEDCRVRTGRIAEAVQVARTAEGAGCPIACTCERCTPSCTPLDECRACGGDGWLTDAGIVRCHVCERFDSDTEAQNHVRTSARGEDLCG